MRIANAARFDDVDYDAGFAYRGCNYLIQHEPDEFFVRTYDDEPGKATVLHPTSVGTNGGLRTLIEFLQSELKVSSVSLYKADVGAYAEVDMDSLEFKE